MLQLVVLILFLNPDNKTPCVASKILERILDSNVAQFSQKNKLLLSIQYVYRHNFICETERLMIVNATYNVCK